MNKSIYILNYTSGDYCFCGKLALCRLVVFKLLKQLPFRVRVTISKDKFRGSRKVEVQFNRLSFQDYMTIYIVMRKKTYSLHPWANSQLIGMFRNELKDRLYCACPLYVKVEAYEK